VMGEIRITDIVNAMHELRLAEHSYYHHDCVVCLPRDWERLRQRFAPQQSTVTMIHDVPIHVCLDSRDAARRANELADEGKRVALIEG
jgi:hypothetical protein